MAVVFVSDQFVWTIQWKVLLFNDVLENFIKKSEKLQKMNWVHHN